MFGVTQHDDYLDSFGIPGQTARAARYINARTEPGDHVVIWGWNTDVLFLSNRSSSHRFGYTMPLVMAPTSPDGGRQQLEYREEFLAGVRASPPVFIVVGGLSGQILGRVADVHDFPEFQRLLERDYREDASFGSLTLWRRRTTPGGEG